MSTTTQILLVEDNPDDAALTLRALRPIMASTEIDVVPDGVAALDYLHGGTRPMPGLVLLDLKLPRIDGLEVLARIRSVPRTLLLPVVILTSSDEERDLVAGYTRGANSYVVKPVEFAKFTEAVRQLGLYWRDVNRRPPVQPGP